MEGKRNLTLSLDFRTTLQCQSKSSYWGTTVLKNWKLTLVRIWIGTSDQFVNGCSSYENLLHQPAPSDCCRLSSKVGDRSGKRPAELDLICLMGKVCEGWDKTRLFFWQVSEGLLRNFQKMDENIKITFHETKKNRAGGGGRGELK
jgi:hypothetical protein